MAENGKAPRLILVAAILQFVFVVIIWYLAFVLPPYVASFDDILFGEYRPLIAAALQQMLFLGVIVGVILGISWLIMYFMGSRRRGIFIITGIIGCLIAGILPGLLVIVSGTGIPKEST